VFTPTAKEAAWALEQRRTLFGGRPVIVVAPTGSGAPKTWPHVQKFMELMAARQIHVIVVGEVRQEFAFEVSLQQVAWYRWHLATEKEKALKKAEMDAAVARGDFDKVKAELEAKARGAEVTAQALRVEHELKIAALQAGIQDPDDIRLLPADVVATLTDEHGSVVKASVTKASERPLLIGASSTGTSVRLDVRRPTVAVTARQQRHQAGGADVVDSDLRTIEQQNNDQAHQHRGPDHHQHAAFHGRRGLFPLRPHYPDPGDRNGEDGRHRRVGEQVEDIDHQQIARFGQRCGHPPVHGDQSQQGGDREADLRLRMDDRNDQSESPRDQDDDDREDRFDDAGRSRRGQWDVDCNPRVGPALPGVLDLTEGRLVGEFPEHDLGHADVVTGQGDLWVDFDGICVRSVDDPLGGADPVLDDDPQVLPLEGVIGQRERCVEREF
jgi:hypothetical protein